MQTQPKAWKTVLLTIWFAMFASVGIYVLMAFLIAAQGRRPPAPGGAGLLAQGDLLSLVVPIFSLVVGLFLYRSKVPQGGTVVYGGTGEPGSKPLTPAALLTAAIRMMAAFEATAVFGLVLFFIGAPMALFLRFCAAAAVLYVIALMKILQDSARVEAGDAGPKERVL